MGRIVSHARGAAEPGGLTGPKLADAVGLFRMAGDFVANGGPHHSLSSTSCSIEQSSVGSATSRLSILCSSCSRFSLSGRRISGRPCQRTVFQHQKVGSAAPIFQQTSSNVTPFSTYRREKEICPFVKRFRGHGIHHPSGYPKTWANVDQFGGAGSHFHSCGMGNFSSQLAGSSSANFTAA